MAAAGPGAGRGDSQDLGAVWSPAEVRNRLEAAGRTLLSLPMPERARPGDARSRWPDPVRGLRDTFIALVDASDEIRADHAESRLNARITPNARAVAEMDEALQWLWLIGDARKRRLCMARALVHPVSERHVASYGKLARIFGLHRDTLRIWHDRALTEIAMTLTRDNVPKKRDYGRRRPG